MKYIIKTAVPRRTTAPDHESMMRTIFPQQPEWEQRTPPVDVREAQDHYLLEAEIPGVAEDAIEVKIEDALLTIVAHQDEEGTAAGDNGASYESYLMRERPRHSFGRSFALPGDVDRDAVKAEYHDGVLSLRLEKTAESRPRSIPINE